MFKILKSAFPVKLLAQETPEIEIVDPAVTLKEKCTKTPHCQHLKERLDKCTERVNNKPGTTESCEEELFDFLNCIDHCVAPELFKYLK